MKSHVSTCDNLIEIFLWPLTALFANVVALDSDEHVTVIIHGNTDFPQNTCTVAFRNIFYCSLINGSSNLWRRVYKKRIDGVPSWASLTQGAVSIEFFRL